MSSARAKKAAGIRFPAPFEESSSAIPQRRYGARFRKVSVKNVSVKKMDDAGAENHKFRCVIPLPYFFLWAHVERSLNLNFFSDG
jgi:hypothetical protein